MKKLSLIIGRKQIIIGSMTAMLAVAVYINYAFTDPSDSSLISTLSVEETENAENVDNEMYGDTVFVNANEDEAVEKETEAETSLTADSDDYFAQARLDRDSSRNEAVATLQTVIGGGDVSEDEMVSTAIEAVDMSTLIESEAEIETLIKSLGFEDCIVYLSDDSAKVVVKTDGLEASDAAAIKDIIVGEITVASENIKIFEIK